MAFTLENIRARINTSLHGRRFGLTNTDYAAGMKDSLRPVTNATSDTTGTAIPGYGFHTVETTTNDTWTLSDPEHAGVEVSLATLTTSTGVRTISPAAATIVSSNGVAGSAIALNGLGDRITLVGISTSQWMVKTNDGTCTVSS